MFKEDDIGANKYLKQAFVNDAWFYKHDYIQSIKSYYLLGETLACDTAFCLRIEP